MQDHGIAAGHEHVVRARAGRAKDLQARLLLELVTDAPAQGDTIDELAARLSERREDIEAAVAELGSCGLLERHERSIRASAAARRFDELWPAV